MPKTLASEYQRGYVAGKKISTAAARRARYDAVFCAALTGLLAGGSEWSQGTRKFTSVDAKVDLAKMFAERALLVLSENP